MTEAGGESLVGFDIGGTNVRAVAVDASGEVRDAASRSRPAGVDPLVETVVAEFEELATRSAAPIGRLGIGCAGLVDRAGVVRTSPNIPSLVDVPLRALIEEQLDLPVMVENDATTACWAETVVGAARGRRDVLFVGIGTGIGGCHVLDGAIRRGTSGFAGEIGHMVVDPGGPPCPCGRHGCWEQLASGTALGRMAREAVDAGRAPSILERAGGDPTAVVGEHVTELFLQGDPLAAMLVEKLAGWIGLGTANLVNVLDPEIVVFGGGLAEVGPDLIDEIRAGVAANLHGGYGRPDLEIVGASLGGDAGAIGAALLAATA